MLILVAGRNDPASERLAERWAAHDATLLTAGDLSAAGWRQFQGCAGRSMAVAGGRAVGNEEITGVLIRWPGIYEEELSQIVPADRAYVAAEMNAFLIYWATRLDCPVLNRPAANSLLGPGWRPEQWARAAADLGLRVQPVRRRAAFASVPEPAAAPPSSAVTVVGGRCLGALDPELARQACRLAKAAGVDLLEAHFSGPEAGASFLGVALLPDLSADGVADAVLAFLLERGGRR